MILVGRAPALASLRRPPISGLPQQLMHKKSMLALATALVVNVVVQKVMQTPEALLSRLALLPGMATGSRRLVAVMGQLCLLYTSPSPRD